MSRTVRELVKTGFLLAGGMLSFCASLFLLAYGLDAVWSEGHFVSSAWLGWVELSLAAVLIPLTMHLWMQFFAGCVGFGFLKTVVVAIAGRDWFPPHLAFSRLEAAEMALFFGSSRSFGWQGLLGPDRSFPTGLPSPCTCSLSSGIATIPIFPSCRE